MTRRHSRPIPHIEDPNGELAQRVKVDQSIHDKVLTECKPELESYLTRLKYPVGASTAEKHDLRELLSRMHRQLNPDHKLTTEDELIINRTIEAVSKPPAPFSDAEIDEQRKAISNLVFAAIRYHNKNLELQALQKVNLELQETANRQLKAIIRANDLLISFNELQLRLPQVVDSLHDSLQRLNKRVGVAS